ncbi:UPF0149 family protein [Aromatoleum aromaticum]|uniref:YecA family protein n=1 Tax=Aromatoleum aromaticum (strain DSM 19018 / LMG 30748 / EbN1) TaxID=76114 RepID=Q5P0Q8_AROAE|nr:UPF0149 family protein [Aromatoleum aromaticum]CAI09106.1 conserved hypothetical protein [Aromatoleum aromaticum EbN1]
MNIEAAPQDETPNSHLLDDAEFEALEELLTSDAVPEDCMDLEMLDGYLVAVLASPQRIAPERWLPEVWSAHGEDASFGSGSRMQRAIGLVRRYYNELATTIGEPEGWEPFCYAASDGDSLRIGEEWIEGFAQGLELWSDDWDREVPEDAAQVVRDAIDTMMAPWADEAAASAADDAMRLQWLEIAVTSVGQIIGQWRPLGLAPVELLSVDEPAAPAPASAGRNEACPCGSGKKYKKCCGAPR